MQCASFLRQYARSISAALLLFVGAGAACATDTYNAPNLSIPTVVIGGATYTNMVVTVGSIVSGPSGSSGNGSVDTYDPATNRLTIPNVLVGATTFHNVVITVGTMVSVASVTGADSYSPPNLSISSVQVGAQIYNNVTVTVGHIDQVGAGMPAAVRDSYSNGQLIIPAVQVGARVFTNVIITVGSIVAVGGVQTSVLTQDYDIARSGANLYEQILTPANVNSATFGKLFSYAVDEEICAQPLYVPNLVIAGVSHNVVFIATMRNTVYAFDADDPAQSATPLWSVHLAAGVPSSRFLFGAGSGLASNGIYSTPVIDPSTNTLYVLTHEWNSASTSVALQLHALDVSGGTEKFGGPVPLGAPAFDPVLNLQRAGLLLLNGTVYVALGSHSDIRTSLSTLLPANYFGMVLGYDARSLAQTGVFNAEAGGLGAAIWQGGRGLASDGNFIYAMTGNAQKTGPADYSESFVQLNPDLSVADFLQDPNHACLNLLDEDLGSSGPQIMPGSGAKLLLGGGKEGKVYALQLGQKLSGQSASFFWGSNNFPFFPAVGGTCTDSRTGADGQLLGSDTAFWSNSGGDSYYYSLANSGELMSWRVSGTTFTQTSVDTPINLAINALVVSANGGANGILWTVSNQNTRTQLLSAYKAVPSNGHLSLLWSSAQNLARDAPGQAARFAVPTVANGKVYVASGSNGVSVFGLLPKVPSVVVTPALGTVAFTALNPATVAVHVNPIAGYVGKVSLTLSGLPAGATYSFTPAALTLAATQTTVTSNLSISMAGAAMPLASDYSVTVQASAAGGGSRYAGLRLSTRSALFTAVSKVGCNSSNQMDERVSWQMNGSIAPALFIQDAITPAFPGRKLMNLSGSSGTIDTGYVVNENKPTLLWLIDQSAGASANFENALQISNLGVYYSCP